MSIFATIDKLVVRDSKSSLGNLERMLAGIDWNFNSYGGINEGCYKDWSLDIHAAWKVRKLFVSIFYMLRARVCVHTCVCMRVCVESTLLFIFSQTFL
ncbi:hypothetical protein ACSBR2_038919 [Camellia fascicularis]